VIVPQLDAGRTVMSLPLMPQQFARSPPWGRWIKKIGQSGQLGLKINGVDYVAAGVREDDL
jgi:hypothetical protein